MTMTLPQDVFDVITDSLKSYNSAFTGTTRLTINGVNFDRADLPHTPALIEQPTPPSADQVPEVVGYTNYRGEHSYRSIIPQRVWYGSTEYHPNPQWFLKAFDTDKQAYRDFALCDFSEAPRTSPPREQCCVCGADVDTREVSEGGGPDGAQLSGGKWVCFRECFDVATDGDWIRAEDHAAAIETARDDALREAKAAIGGVDLGFYAGTSGDWHEYSAADVHFNCLLAVSAMIGQPAPPREVTVQELAADPKVQALVEAVEWYQEQARLCRLVHSEGDKGRHALAADGGAVGRTALAAFKETEE